MKIIVTPKLTLSFLLLLISTLIINAQTSLFVANANSVYIKSLTVSAKGHVTNNGTINTNNSGIITFNGTSSQNLDGSAINTTSFNRINISNTAGVSLGTNVTVFGTTGLDFTTGSLFLNAASIRFSSGSVWTSNTTSKFFVTNGIGLLYVNNTGSAVTYPIGVAAGSTNYKPITLTNSGTADMFGVRVQPDLYYNYNSIDGTGIGSPGSTDAVALTWVINEVVPGGSTLLVTPQWNLTNEVGGFVRASSMIGYYNYATSKFINGAVGGTSGANPYTKSLTITPSALAFTPLGVGGALSPMPISLLSFKAVAANNDARLVWITTSETNNDYFEIQRSDDAFSFKKIGVRKGAGNSVERNEYNYTDLSVAGVINYNTAYYRLKQVDFDGHYSYSPIASVRFSDNNADLLFYPNPAQHYLNIVYKSKINSEMQISVVDQLGITVKEFTKLLNIGDNTFLVDLYGLQNAIYTVVIYTPNRVITKKLIVSE